MSDHPCQVIMDLDLSIDNLKKYLEGIDSNEKVSINVDIFRD